MKRFVPAACDALTGIVSCPAGAWRLQTNADKPGVCRIGQAPDAPIIGMAGSITRIPTEDGRCVSIADRVRLKDGSDLSNVAFEMPDAGPLRTCPRQLAYIAGQPRDSVVAHAFGEGYVHQITGGYLLSGKSFVTYRRFRVDPNAVFGFTEQGTGLGYWDTRLEQIVLRPPEPRFETELDYGNASFVSGSYAYIWGCNRHVEDYLLEGCLLGRFDVGGAPELYLGGGLWSRVASAVAGAVVFTDGPWISSVVSDPVGLNRLQHFSIAEFDRRLSVHTAASPEGPWADARVVATLSVPEKPAFAAGPVVHEELGDPTHPGEVVVSYDVDTTDPAITDHLGFGWSQMEWIAP